MLLVINLDDTTGLQIIPGHQANLIASNNWVKIASQNGHPLKLIYLLTMKFSLGNSINQQRLKWNCHCFIVIFWEGGDAKFEGALDTYSMLSPDVFLVVMGLYVGEWSVSLLVSPPAIHHLAPDRFDCPEWLVLYAWWQCATCGITIHKCVSGLDTGYNGQSPPATQFTQM